MTTANLILGAGGQLGHDLAMRLGSAVSLDRTECDLTSVDSLRAALQLYRPDVVWNCAAYNFVDRAETEPAVAFGVNAIGVRNLAIACGELGATLVQFSSDYVFGMERDRSTPYRETDPPGPLSVYGASKLAGEYFVRSTCPKHYVIRTCGLYGAWGAGGKGGNFVETMLRLASEGKHIRVVTDEVCTPTYTADLADASIRLASTGHYGLYHVTNSGFCSRYEFAKEIFRLSGQSVSIQPIRSSEFGAAACRPAYAALDMEKYQGLGNAPMRTWQDALAAYVIDRKRAGR